MTIDRDRYTIVEHQMNGAVLIITARYGSLCNGYLNAHELSKRGDAAAMIKRAATLEDLLKLPVEAVTPQAKELGVRSGMRGSAALEVLDGRPSE